MDLVLSQLRGDIASGDAGKQMQALVIALQYSASGIDISALARKVCEEIVLAPAGPITKKLAYDVIRTTRLTAEQWESVCRGVANDLEYHDRDVTATAAAFLTSIPSWKIGKFILDHNKEISACIVDPNPNLRQAVIEALGCLLARDDIVLLCSTNGNLLDRVSAWYKQIGQSMLDSSNQVCKAAFEAVGHLFAEFSGKRLSRMAGDKLIPGEASVAVRCQFVMNLADLVWAKRDLLMARAAILPFESMRYTVLPLVFAARARVTGLLEEMRVLAGMQPSSEAATSQGASSKAGGSRETAAAENVLGISDIVSHLAPYLNSLDPALVYEVGINLLALAGVPGGKAEWAAAPITAFLTLWDRQEYGAGREALVRAVASNIQLLDLHLQVALFKRLLLMVRNLRVEADRMHALARVCRTALAVDLFAKESVRRGQKPMLGTDVSSLFEDAKTREELSEVSSGGLFREELVACLVESCFQLSQPLPEASTSGNRVLGSLSLATSQEAMGWTHAALGVVEVCRPCVKWDCNGRTYAMDAYLRLLVRLCHLYETSKGIKSAKDGATSEQILAEQRLQMLQKQLLLDLENVATRRMRVRLLWSLCEHLNLDGLTNPLLADDSTDPVNILVFNLHELLFNVDSGTALVTNRLQDVQALLLCAQHLGARNARAASLLILDLENFRASSLADTVNKNQCRLVVNVLKHIQEKPLSRWTGWVSGTGEYPFGHQKLSVQYNEPASAQDRKLEDLVKTAVKELWRPAPSELALAVTGGRSIRPVSPAKTLSGSSDPCYLEAHHLADVNERKLTLNMKIVNVTELQLPQVDVRVGLDGAVDFLDKSPQALRQLKDLASQDPVLVDVTVTVSKFERCTLHVQLLYYPGGGESPAAADMDETTLNEYGDILPKSRRGSANPAVVGRGEPVVLRCKPYRVPLTELLLPAECAPVDFFRLWPTLPAMVDFTCAYEYDPTDKDSLASGVGLPPFMSGLAALSGKPLARVCSHIVRTTQGFQLCYLARTWFGDTLGMVVFGNSEPATVGGFGDDATTASCRFVFRSSSEHVVAEIKAEAQFWFDDLTDGAVRLLTEREIEEDARVKLERAMQPVHLTLPPIKTKQDDDSLLPGMGPKAPATGQAEEQMALQAAVLQEWHILRAQQVH